MPVINTQASIEIAAPIANVHSVIVDFRTWPVWSPWLYIEPDSQMQYRGTLGEAGHGYDWEGQKVGAGSMTLTHTTNEQIDCDLQFLKPFKSSARVQFDLHEISEDRTRVTWHMDSRLPIFLFFMTGTISGMIRADYRRGLAMLKDFLEDGKVHSRCTVEGIVEVDAVDYVGCTATTPMMQISESMKASFEQLKSSVKTGAFVSNGKPFSILRRMDYKRDTCAYTAALPASSVAGVVAPLAAGRRPACSALKVVHIGPYRHLGNAWAMLISEARHRKLKAQKSIPAFECYRDDPGSTPAIELVTELFLPLRQ
jgi:effector-binding domain-containing protein